LSFFGKEKQYERQNGEAKAGISSWTNQMAAVRGQDRRSRFGIMAALAQ